MAASLRDQKVVLGLLVWMTEVEGLTWRMWTVNGSMWWRWRQGELECCSDLSRDEWDIVDIAGRGMGPEHAVAFTLGYNLAASGVDPGGV